ncbi:MAG: M20/M25/M40 family metallo-hydrolase [Acetobacterales bacterium]
MAGSREGAMKRARKHFDDGGFLKRLAEWIAVPTEAQKLESQPELYRFLTDYVKPYFEEMGFETTLYDNPVEKRGPFIIATRMEDPSKPTLLTYGHGDVVTAFKEEWSEGLDPWVLKEDGDYFYGRGTSDDKGQFQLCMAAQHAVIQERGSLGFNSKFLIETGEEQGSPGLKKFIQDHTKELAADVMVWADGPRLAKARQEIDCGSRGGVFFDLVVDLKREGGLHSGHWGGVMPDAGIILAQALASITTPKGRILIEDWLPKKVPQSVLDAIAKLEVDPVKSLPDPDPEWGHTELTTMQKVMANTSFIILAYRTGNPDNPVNSVPSYAKARCQIRHTADVPREDFVPALRKHLDARGFRQVEIAGQIEREQFPASRTDPNEPWVAWAIESLTRSTGVEPNVVPNAPGSNPADYFRAALDLPAFKIPHSYKGCKQHGPDEHGLKSMFSEGMEVMAGFYWDMGEPGTPPNRGIKS